MNCENEKHEALAVAEFKIKAELAEKERESRYHEALYLEAIKEVSALRNLCENMSIALIDLQCCPDCLLSVTETGFSGHKCAAGRGEDNA